MACWVATGQGKGQHRPKAGKKKKTRKVDLFFSGPCFVLDASAGSGLTHLSPHKKIGTDSSCHACQNPADTKPDVARPREVPTNHYSGHHMVPMYQ